MLYSIAKVSPYIKRDERALDVTFPTAARCRSTNEVRGKLKGAAAEWRSTWSLHMLTDVAK
jgi:hypothetical protein